jgi:lactate dehydrogenase-like 2-hydroxyacid dehydrogenase
MTRKIPQKAFQILKETKKFEIISHNHEEAIPKEEFVSLLKKNQDIEAILCTLSDKITPEVLNLTPKLKVISTMSVGYDHIDLKACKNSNISVGYTPDVLTDTTADIAVALLLATSRRIPEAVKEGKWPAWKPEWLLGKEVSKATVGIFGFGRIGQSFARKMNKAFDCKILYSGLNGRKEKEEKETNATYVDLKIV